MPDDRPVAVHCEGGYRSATAASVLAKSGRSNVMDVVGGFKAWVTSQLPYEAPEAPELVLPTATKRPSFTANASARGTAESIV